MMTALLIRGVTLEGASTGVEFYIKPEISELGNLEVEELYGAGKFYVLNRE